MTEEKPENPVLRMLAVPFLTIVGILYLLAAFLDSFRNWIDRWIGGVNFIYLGVGFLFFYMAVLVAEKNLIRQKFLGLLNEIKGFFLGPDHQKISGAVEILINALKKGDGQAAQTASRELSKITGRDFGMDHAKWEAWWLQNRIPFLMSRQKTPGKDSHDISP